MKIEAKIEIDKRREREVLRKELKSLLTSAQQTNHNSYPNKRSITERNLIYSQTNGEEFLRIRYETVYAICGNGHSTIITYTGKDLGEKFSKHTETETHIAIYDHLAFEKLLCDLGFKFYSSYINKREETSLPDVVISLDQVMAADRPADPLLWRSTVWRFVDQTIREQGITCKYLEQLDGSSMQNFIEVGAKTEQQVSDTIKVLGLEDKPIIHESYAKMFASP